MSVPGGHRPGSVPQLPLALRYPSEQGLDGYVAAPVGLLDQLRAMASLSSNEWLYLAGGPGTGKTHLALATCAIGASLGTDVAYVPLRTAAGRLEAALQACESRSLVALDGVEAIAGKRNDEVVLFEFHNRARASGSCVLYTAGAAPDDLSLVLPDLRSRLSQCARTTLLPLDDDGRRALMRARARNRGLLLEEAALDWLLRRQGRDLAGMTARLDALDRASLAAQRRVTVPFLRQFFGA